MFRRLGAITVAAACGWAIPGPVWSATAWDRIAGAHGDAALQNGKVVPLSGVLAAGRNPSPGGAPGPAANVSIAQAADSGVVLVDRSAFGPRPANEPAIAVDPSDGNHLIASANDYRFGDSQGGRYSALAGPASFDDVNGVLQFISSSPYYYNASGDPAVGIDRFGIDYFAVLAFDRTVPAARSGVLVARSIPAELGKLVDVAVPVDQQPATSAFFDDKDSLGVDNVASSSFRGSVYSFFTQFAPKSSPILGSYSRNQGVSFAKPTLVSKPASRALCPLDKGACADDQGSSPGVGPHGYVYVAYENFDTPSNVNQIFISESKDGGATFSPPHKVSDSDDITNPYKTFRVNSFPNLAVNRVTGQLYVTWSDQRSGSPVVYVTTSTHGIGGPWSKPVSVNGVRFGSFQFFPAITVQPSTGDLYVSYYDNLKYPRSNVYDYDYRRFSATLIPEIAATRVSRSPIVASLDFSGGFIGDYTSAAARGSGAQLIWTGTSTGRQDIESAFVP